MDRYFEENPIEEIFAEEQERVGLAARLGIDVKSKKEARDEANPDFYKGDFDILRANNSRLNTENTYDDGENQSDRTAEGHIGLDVMDHRKTLYASPIKNTKSLIKIYSRLLNGEFNEAIMHDTNDEEICKDISFVVSDNYGIIDTMLPENVNSINKTSREIKIVFDYDINAKTEADYWKSKGMSTAIKNNVLEVRTNKGRVIAKYDHDTLILPRNNINKYLADAKENPSF